MLKGTQGVKRCVRLPRWHYPFKMCRDPRHTFVFHAPEARFIPPEGVLHTPEGVLHVPKGCFMCRRRASYPRRGASYPEGVLHVPKARLIAELCSAYSLLQPFGTKKSL